MMKFLLLVAVIAVAFWMLKSKARGRGDAPRPPKPPGGPQPMLACAHCGVHLPRADALMDVGGRAFCSDAHRLAGPRT
jgi:uncharacterized protein